MLVVFLLIALFRGGHKEGHKRKKVRPRNAVALPKFGRQSGKIVLVVIAVLAFGSKGIFRIAVDLAVLTIHD